MTRSGICVELCFNSNESVFRFLQCKTYHPPGPVGYLGAVGHHLDHGSEEVVVVLVASPVHDGADDVTGRVVEQQLRVHWLSLVDE